VDVFAGAMALRLPRDIDTHMRLPVKYPLWFDTGAAAAAPAPAEAGDSHGDSHRASFPGDAEEGVAAGAQLQVVLKGADDGLIHEILVLLFERPYGFARYRFDEHASGESAGARGGSFPSEYVVSDAFAGSSELGFFHGSFVNLASAPFIVACDQLANKSYYQPFAAPLKQEPEPLPGAAGGGGWGANATQVAAACARAQPQAPAAARGLAALSAADYEGVGVSGWLAEREGEGGGQVPVRWRQMGSQGVLRVDYGARVGGGDGSSAGQGEGGAGGAPQRWRETVVYNASGYTVFRRRHPLLPVPAAGCAAAAPDDLAKAGSAHVAVEWVHGCGYACFMAGMQGPARLDYVGQWQWQHGSSGDGSPAVHVYAGVGKTAAAAAAPTLLYLRAGGLPAGWDHPSAGAGVPAAAAGAGARSLHAAPGTFHAFRTARRRVQPLGRDGFVLRAVVAELEQLLGAEAEAAGEPACGGGGWPAGAGPALWAAIWVTVGAAVGASASALCRRRRLSRPSLASSPSAPPAACLELELPRRDAIAVPSTQQAVASL